MTFRSLTLAALAAITGVVGSAHADAAPTKALRAGFGRSLAIAGNYAFIGEPGGGGRPGNPSSGGAVWVFRRGATAWTNTSTLTLPEGVSSAGFGVAVAAVDDVLLVGHVEPRGFGANAAPTAPGAVHVYRRGADGRYTDAGTLPAPDVAGSGFGRS